MLEINDLNTHGLYSVAVKAPILQGIYISLPEV